MFFPKPIIDSVAEVAHIRYIDKAERDLWNQHRRAGELKMLCGYAWYERNGGKGRAQQGLATYSAAIRDAYDVLVERQPAVRRLRLAKTA